MNIFILDTDPKIAASYHCDQHINKMILESAQMLSTVALHYATYRKDLNGLPHYKPTHSNHPCVKWLREDINNVFWMYNMCCHLETIRLSRDQPEHKSMEILHALARLLEVDFITVEDPRPKNFIFAGPPIIGIRPSLSIVQKYRLYYRFKHRAWLDTAEQMSYKNRPVPDFLQDLSFPSTSGISFNGNNN